MTLEYSVHVRLLISYRVFALKADLDMRSECNHHDDCLWWCLRTPPRRCLKCFLMFIIFAAAAHQWLETFCVICHVGLYIVWVCAWNFRLHVWPKQSTNFVEWMNEVAIFGHKLPHSQTHKNFVFSFPVRRGCNYGTTFCTYNLSIQLLKKWHFLDLVRQAAQVTRRDGLDFP